MAKFIPDYTKNVTLDVNVKRLLKVFSFRMVSDWVKLQLDNVNIQGLSYDQVVCPEFAMDSKLHFSRWKTYVSQFIKVMQYLIMFEIRATLFYVNYPPYFRQWNDMFKTGIFECWP